MNADGGSPTQLTFGTDANNFPPVSPDGRYIVFETNRGVGWSVRRSNADGGAPKELARDTGQFSYPQVSADGRRVYYASVDPSGRRVVWRGPIDGGKPRPLTDWKSDRIFWFAWSRDGRQLAVARGDTFSDVMLIKDFR